MALNTLRAHFRGALSEVSSESLQCGIQSYLSYGVRSYVLSSYAVWRRWSLVSRSSPAPAGTLSNISMEAEYMTEYTYMGRRKILLVF